MTIQPARFLRRVPLRRRRGAPKLISIFSGCGGAALGMRQAGFEVRVFVEFDRACCQTLALNWIKPRRGEGGRRSWHQRRDPAILQADITKLTTAEILRAAALEVGEADCLEGGFPCQGFSTAGRRIIGDPRNRLYRECVRVIAEALPKTFFLENVPGLVSMASGAIMRQICADFAGVGYDLSWDILNAADYGVPQRRRRVIFLGRRVDGLVFPARGRPRVYLGCAAGAVQHPKWFEEKYPVGAKQKRSRARPVREAA